MNDNILDQPLHIEESSYARGFFHVEKRGNQQIVTGWCVISEGEKLDLPDCLEVFAEQKYLGACAPDQGREDVVAELGEKCPTTSGFLWCLPDGIDPDNITVKARWGDKVQSLAPQFENHGIKNFTRKIPKDLLPFINSPHLRVVTFGLTEACNLRCVYCTTRAMEKIGTHEMDPDIVLKWDDSFINGLKAVTEEVFFAGNGEPTMRKDWAEIFKRLRKAGIKINMTTNLSLRYTDEEIRTLTDCHRISVSLDTPDADLHCQLRPHSRLETIKDNIRRIKKASENRPEPVQIGFSTVCSNKSFPTLPELARLGVDLDIDFILLISLALAAPLKQVGLNLYPLSDFSGAELEAAKKSLSEFCRIMVENKKVYFLPPDLQVLADSKDIGNFQEECCVNLNESGSTTSRIHPETTRDCLAAWSELNCFQGYISPCCVMRSQVPYANDTDLREILNDPFLMNIRYGLYTGKPVPTCERCNIRGTIPLKDFQEKVKQYIGYTD